MNHRSRATHPSLVCPLLLIALVAALAASAASRLHAQAAQEAPRTVLYLHGRIYTNDPQHPWAQGMGVRDGQIICIGAISQVMLECGGGEAHAETVDLHEKFVMPGFNDAHVHLGAAGQGMLAVRLYGAASIEELKKRLAASVASHKPGEWITGAGWDHTLWPEKQFPNKSELDDVAPKNPVLLTHVSGHVAVANSLALKLAELDKNSPSPPGGEFERDSAGELTGMLKERRAIEFVRSRIPDPSVEQRRRGITLVLADLAKNGVTSAQDNSEWEDFRAYKQIKEDGKLTVRITEWLHFAEPLNDLQNKRAEGGTTDPWLKTGALKMVTDGALGSRTAAMLEPYSDDAKSTGILIMEPDKLKSLAIERDKAGFQLNFHAIGDRANRVALDVFEAVAKVNGPRDRRDRIEHAQVVAPDDLSRFAKLKVIASMQPSHQTTDMRWAESRVGPERIKGAYAWATIEKSGARLAFGTDYPVEVVSPLRGLYACVTRLPDPVGQSPGAGKLPDGTPSSGWQPQEKISLQDCISAYTSGSAYAEFEDGKKGELKPGEYADFIVLSNDLTKVPPPDYLKTEVLQTVVGGRTVYEKP
jgi:predicted amidohydrolase YtcJ